MIKILLQLFLILINFVKVEGNYDDYYSTICRSGRVYLFQECVNYVRSQAPQCAQYYNNPDFFRVVCNINWQVPNEAEFNGQYNHFHYVPHALWYVTNQVQAKYFYVDWSTIFENFRPHAQKIQYLIGKALNRWGGVLNLQFQETTNMQEAVVIFTFKLTREDVDGRAIAGTINRPRVNIDPNTCTPYPSTQYSYIYIYPSDWMEFDEEVARRQTDLFLRVFNAVIKKEHHFTFNKLFDEFKFKSSFYIVILHELGHTFGILHNHQDIYSLMSPVASREFYDLTEFDIAEMKCLYNLP